MPKGRDVTGAGGRQVAVQALLTNRDGFIKYVEVPFPPAPTYRVAKSSIASPGMLSYQVVLFYLITFDQERCLALYKEA